MKKNFKSPLLLRIFFFLFLFFFLKTGIVWGQSYFASDPEPGTDHLLILHPTRTNLERFSYLIEEDILPLPDNLEVVWVYTAFSTMDYFITFGDYPEFHFNLVNRDKHYDSIYSLKTIIYFFEK